jgi:Flp pilus assembly protein TadG
VVELALCLPLVCLMLLGVVQVAVIVRDQQVVQHAAREAARAASVSSAPATAAGSVVHAIAPDAAVSVAAGADRVTATVTMTTHTDVPLIGALIPDVALTSSATMAREPP